jgi:MarR family transcriptional regulator, organic hydroperoxide resistance regulator
VTQQSIDDVRQAFGQLLGAERRLRARDQQRQGPLTYSHVRALVALDTEGAMPAGALAKASGLNPGTLTAMIDRLEAEEIVERHRSETDRRVVTIALTPRGSKLLGERRREWQRIWNQALAGADDAELAAVSRIMRQMADVLDTL